MAPTTASAAQRAASIQLGSSEACAGARERADGQPVPARHDLSVDGGRLESGSGLGIPLVIAAFAAGTVDPRLGVLGRTEPATRLLQHVEKEARDPAGGLLITRIGGHVEQLGVVGQHPLVVRDGPIAAGRVPEEPSLHRIAELGRGHRRERAVGDGGRRGVCAANGRRLEEPQGGRDRELRNGEVAGAEPAELAVFARGDRVRGGGQIVDVGHP